jgi:hypothetical protein
MTSKEYPGEWACPLLSSVPCLLQPRDGHSSPRLCVHFADGKIEARVPYCSYPQAECLRSRPTLTACSAALMVPQGWGGSPGCLTPSEIVA